MGLFNPFQLQEIHMVLEKVINYASFFLLILLAIISTFGYVNVTLAIALAGLYVGSNVLSGLYDLAKLIVNK